MNKKGQNLEIKSLENNLPNNKIRWYEHVLRMDKEIHPKIIWNMK
jgi:hypothetical protein